MATLSVEHGMLWTDLEGQELPGGWRLKKLVRPEGRNAWFDATGPDGRPAVVSLTEALNDEEELLERLRAAAAIRHPNVVQVREARLVWMGDTPVVMAAMEPTEENLAEVLRERALEPAEARLLMDALLQGLAAIHARRLTHGRMEVGSVLAMGDTVKLRSDCLHVAEFSARAGENVRGVGRLVTQALTRRIPASENDPVLQLVPEPMARAVRRALSGTATVEEVAALVGTRLAKAAEAAPRSSAETRAVALSAVAEIRRRNEAEQKAEEPAMPEKTLEPAAARPSELPSGPSATTVQMDLPLRPRWRENPVGEEKSEHEAGPREGVLSAWLAAVGELPKRWNYHRRGAPWVIAAAVGLLLATALMLQGWLRPKPAAKRAVANPRIVVEGANPVKPPASIAKPAGAAPVWHVVAYTYRRQSEAEKRAQGLAQRYPQLQPAVMTTRGGDFLVTLGGAMSRAEAMALRARAVRMGLPRDTYAQNFK